MSQRDLVAELRGARPAAPADVREQVRLIAASAPVEPPRRFTLRRALVVALPVAAAVAAAVVFTTRPSHPSATSAAEDHAAVLKSTAQGRGFATPPSVPQAGAATQLAPQPSGGRAQRYEAYLALRVRTTEGVSDGVKRALHIASSLGGYPTSVHASSKTAAATADLTLKVPRARVQTAIERLSALGTITSESVEVQDAQAGLNATDRTLERLQRQLRSLRSQQVTPAVAAQIATLTARAERLQRARAATLRQTRYATIQLHLQTKQAAAPAKHEPGPLHGLGVVFRWVGIVAIYVVALGAPLALLVALGWLVVRTMRRRREDALLSSP
jgi:uncharacterized protein DUF4349